MNICRFTSGDSVARVGLITAERDVLDLTPAGVGRIQTILEAHDPVAELKRLSSENLPRLPGNSIRMQKPVESQEVWAAGVTYSRSKQARMVESEFSATAYDRVYDAERPEVFFKSLPEKVVSPGEFVGIRKDSVWNVPEPELALVINSSGRVVGFTVGNDMSSRSIEGENLLYLPQAKIYTGSCAVGPHIVVGETEETARTWSIVLDIYRGDQKVFGGETQVSRIKRSFAELASYLFRSQQFPNGAVLLTGTGIVPPDSFTLEAGDRIRIACSGIGVLENTVNVV